MTVSVRLNEEDGKLIKAYAEGLYPYGDKVELNVSESKKARKKRNIIEQDLFNQIEEVEYGKEK